MCFLQVRRRGSRRQVPPLKHARPLGRPSAKGPFEDNPTITSGFHQTAPSPYRPHGRQGRPGEKYRVVSGPITLVISYTTGLVRCLRRRSVGTSAPCPLSARHEGQLQRRQYDATFQWRPPALRMNARRRVPVRLRHHASRSREEAMQ